MRSVSQYIRPRCAIPSCPAPFLLCLCRTIFLPKPFPFIAPDGITVDLKQPGLKAHETLLNSSRSSLHRCEEAPNEDEVEIRIPAGARLAGETGPIHHQHRHVCGPHLARPPYSKAAATLRSDAPHASQSYSTERQDNKPTAPPPKWPTLQDPGR
jgi:hypothetical protein